ncbi:uncharacterized protein PFL1_02864 [Pseudozyma flocculosa PF-1]|uniref:HSac2 domain-containing protein n=2 Tax=Pseudozyma flocculosa TaxID=84751 RepID=A0A5C3F4R2_9BASI|nr:uncharacterized protein PFL1_02864 [Pseudozyma flocculosa PF-1]EPQ29644.1 hypothetical protein PFL1_02864 [Pseudozyma flocculosa PF-1]SPO38211.1 uncharacterized protein PSFLO_03688 [Pseudozyma flocculosa]
MTADKAATAVAPASVAPPQPTAAIEEQVAPAAPSGPTTTVTSPARQRRPRFVVSEKALDAAFNDVWANNANAISHCYSNTDALKVDFTRTGKRSFMGMINDATNSVYRMVQGAVTDFFRQTVLDFVYGSIGIAGLERYYDDLDSRDPSEAVRLVRVRASAIESCKAEVIPNDETLVGGWTLCSPVEPNQIQSAKLEEKVVLLTRKALYVCSYDFGGERLSQFTKVLVGDIIGIKEGLYIINPNEGHHPEDNWGFVITYLNDESRAHSTTSIKLPSPASLPAGTSRLLAFRAISDDLDLSASPKAAPTVGSRFGFHLNVPLPSASASSPSPSRARSRKDTTESDGGTATSKQTVKRIVDLLVRCCQDVGACTGEDDEEFLKSGTVQSLEAAKANAGYLGPLIEGLKRRLWL